MGEVVNEQVSRAELIKLCAVDSDLFSRVYFPKAVRQKSPDFDKELWGAIENPAYRFLNLRVFRGGGKTTKLRLFTAKRIAYNMSKTILYVGASESHAVRSIQWLRARIDPGIGQDGVSRPTEFAQTFGLRPGRKWQEHEIEIFHGVDKTPIWILGVGITGNIRGINFDDYRPDLIIVDDCITDENAATSVASDKITDLLLNAVSNSLASASEFPSAKLVMLQTPISPHDASMKAEADPEWHTEAFGCWTKDTEDSPLEKQKSSWEALFPTPMLQSRKRVAIEQRRYSGFAREMECKLVQSETTSFGRNWLRFYDEKPSVGTCVIAIDPVPPPSDLQIAKGMKTKDFEAITVVGRSKGNYYVLEYALGRGHEPDWTEAKVFEFILKYRPMSIVVEAIAAQRYLKWFLQKAMERRRIYTPLKETPNSQKSKFSRIVTSLSGVASAGKLWCSKEHSELILQFEGYGPGFKGHDDLIESVAVGVSELASPYLELSSEEYEDLDADMSEMKVVRACP